MTRRRIKPDLLDRRARLAAAHLLMAFDLPAPADAAVAQMSAAAKACPGLKMDEIPMMGSGQRRACLERARDLIGEMLG